MYRFIGFCGGGYGMDMPSQIPSLLNFSTSLSNDPTIEMGAGVKPTQLPSISNAPTMTNKPTMHPCTDYDGWSDITGNNCTWYEMHNNSCSEGVLLARVEGVNADVAAIDACCKLHFIFIYNISYYSPLISLVLSGYCGGGHIQCQDVHNWTDQHGDNCTWYEMFDTIGCPTYGTERGTNSIPASKACCWYV